jgi:signal transduction histidine kinase
MKSRKILLFLFAWVCYVAISMLGYPYLRITVLLLSIPLAMLGGWFYSYQGALMTTVVTIPYHYLLLNVHSDDPAVLIEAINPFGIGSQLIFSLGSAWLQATELRYQKLNSGLEQIVAARTNDLQQLNNYLVSMKDIDRSIIASGLLESPLELLESMLKSNGQLCKYLNEKNDKEIGKAKIVQEHIQQCIIKLTEFMEETAAANDFDESLLEKVQELAEGTMQLGGTEMNITLEGNWNRLKKRVCYELYHIISEAVANAIRHAKAKEIIIECRHSPKETTICVENDGENFPDQPSEGMGLPLMRHRAMSVGGTFVIEGGTGRRTRVSCTVPHTAPDNEKAFPVDRQRLNTTI